MSAGDTPSGGLARWTTGRNILLVLLFLIIVALWWGVTYAIQCVYPETYGTRGDSFGAVNALFSGLALAGVVVAILLQSADLRTQSQALRLQTIEMEGTTTALNDQTTLLERQSAHGEQDQFDSRFFEVVRSARAVIVNLDVLFSGGHRVTGVSAVRGLGDELRSTMKPKHDQQNTTDQFNLFKRKNGRYFEPMTQMIEVALEMVVRSPDYPFHGQFLKASFSLEEKWFFYHALVLSREEVPYYLKDAIELTSFFEGIEDIIPESRRLNLSDRAFGP